jgi:hypothetical protein
MDVLNQLFAFFFRALLLVVGVVFVVGLMSLAMVFLVVAMLWSLITGQKHPVHVVWQRARSTREQVWRASRGEGRFGGASRRSGPVSDAQETSVDASDVTDVRDLSQRR